MKDLNIEDLIPVSSRKYRIFYEQFLRRSTLEKILIILLVIALGLLMLIFIGKKTRDVCTTQACVLSASRLLEGLNTSVDPCNDFYEYACGKWKDAHFRPLDIENSWMIDRTEYIHYQIQKFLEDTHNSSDIKPIQQMKLLYKMCMDTEQLNEQGLDPLYSILDALELPRDIPTDLSAENFNLARTLFSIQRLLNFDILIKLSIEHVNALNSTLLVISPSMFEFSFLDHQEEIEGATMEQLLAWHLAYIADVMSEFNTNNSFSMNEIITDASKIILLERQLRKDANQINQTDEKSHMTLAQLQEYMFSNVTKEANIGEALFSWQDCVSVLAEKLNVNLTMSHVVCVENPFYFQTLGSRLVAFKKEFFQKFVWWKVVDSLAIHTTNIMRTRKHILEQRTLKGVLRPTRSSECINLMKYFFIELIIHKMITLHNVSDIIQEVYLMMTNMKKTLKQLIVNSAWLDDGTKYLRIEKIDDVIPIIGYPKLWSNSSWIKHRYRNIEILPNQFLKSLTSINVWMVSELVNSSNGSFIPQFDEDESRFNSWFIDPLLLNAYYSEQLNFMVIPLSFLHFPFYVENIPALNYGAIGYVIGHELNSMFNDEKYLYFEQQLTQQNDTIAEFKKRSQCFIKQYNNFRTANNTRVNGIQTLTENIADSGGIREAFHAYEKYTKKYENIADSGGIREVFLAYEKHPKKYREEPLLPSFEKFTNQQLFFLSYANMWCKKEIGFALDNVLAEDYAPNRFRVLGSLANLAEFSEIWNCPSNSPMNPKTKCKIF